MLWSYKKKSMKHLEQFMNPMKIIINGGKIHPILHKVFSRLVESTQVLFFRRRKGSCIENNIWLAKQELDKVKRYPHPDAFKEHTVYETHNTYYNSYGIYQSYSIINLLIPSPGIKQIEILGQTKFEIVDLSSSEWIFSAFLTLGNSKPGDLIQLFIISQASGTNDPAWLSSYQHLSSHTAQ